MLARDPVGHVKPYMDPIRIESHGAMPWSGFTSGLDEMRESAPRLRAEQLHTYARDLGKCSADSLLDVLAKLCIRLHVPQEGRLECTEKHLDVACLRGMVSEEDVDFSDGITVIYREQDCGDSRDRIRQTKIAYTPLDAYHLLLLGGSEVIESLLIHGLLHSPDDGLLYGLIRSSQGNFL